MPTGLNCARPGVGCEHPRCFGATRRCSTPGITCRCWPVKPGALRNGAPFKNWVCRLGWSGSAASSPAPPMATADGRHPGRGADGWPAAVEAACLERCVKASTQPMLFSISWLAAVSQPGDDDHDPDALRLRHTPTADCARYDNLRSM